MSLDVSQNQVCDSNVISVPTGTRFAGRRYRRIASTITPESPPYGAALFVDVHYTRLRGPSDACVPLERLQPANYLKDSELESSESFRAASIGSRVSCPLCGRPEIQCYDDPTTCLEIRIRSNQRDYDAGWKSFVRLQISREAQTQAGGEKCSHVGLQWVQGGLSFEGQG